MKNKGLMRNHTLSRDKLTLDYLYTNTDKIRVNYTPWQGLCDFVVVVLLFASAGATSNPLRFPLFVPYVALFLAGTKLSCLIWECVRQEKDLLAKWSFSLFFTLYFGAHVFASGNQWVLVGVLAVDITAYYFFKSIRDHLPASFQPEGGSQRASVEGTSS